jgi:hypothetical protein
LQNLRPSHSPRRWQVKFAQLDPPGYCVTD